MEPRTGYDLTEDEILWIKDLKPNMARRMVIFMRQLRANDARVK